MILARGFVLHTPIILLDEPTTFLDVATLPLLVTAIRRANQDREATVIIATHDSAFASSLAHRVIHLDQGRIAADDDNRSKSAGLPA